MCSFSASIAALAHCADTDWRSSLEGGLCAFCTIPVGARLSASRLLLLAKDPKVPALLFRLLTRNCLLAGRVVGPDNLSSSKLHNGYGICWRR